MWGSGSVKSSHQTVSGSSEKSFYLPFWHKTLYDVKLAELSNNSFEWKNMWHFRASKHTLIPPTYFQGCPGPLTPGSTPVVIFAVQFVVKASPRAARYVERSTHIRGCFDEMRTHSGPESSRYTHVLRLQRSAPDAGVQRCKQASVWPAADGCSRHARCVWSL